MSRTVAEGETELLNLAVAPGFRRQGVGRKLVQSLLAEARGVVYLEVRESNRAAREFYNHMGFQEVSLRGGYYQEPPEAAIVMIFIHVKVALDGDAVVSKTLRDYPPSLVSEPTDSARQPLGRTCPIWNGTHRKS